MKPRNKFEEKVFKTSLKLPPLGVRKTNWLKKNIFNHHVYNTKKQHECLNCNHTWKYSGKENVRCPNCHLFLFALEGRYRTHHQWHYAVDLTTFRRYQVVRYYHVMRWLKSKKKPLWSIIPIFEHWLTGDGKHVLISVSRNAMTRWTYLEGWNLCSQRSIKQDYGMHYISSATVINGMKFIPEVIRNGFEGDFMDLDAAFFLNNLLGNPRAETLLKAGQYKLFHFIDEIDDEIWGSIKICLRNNYTVYDPKTWFDHLNLLKYFNKDLRSAKYVCPRNLDKEHQKYVNKRTKILTKERLEKEAKETEKRNEYYKKAKSKYFDLKIVNNELTIEPIQSIEEFIIEQTELNHCIYTCGYYKREDSLILSAKINNKRVETIEFSLDEMQILQCRGSYNQSTEYHELIISTLNNNINKINELKKEKIKT